MPITPVDIPAAERVSVVRGSVAGAVPLDLAPDEDITEKLQAAIDAILATGKGALSLPKRRYRCDRLDLGPDRYLVFTDGFLDEALVLLFSSKGLGRVVPP